MLRASYGITQGNNKPKMSGLVAGSIVPVLAAIDGEPVNENEISGIEEIGGDESPTAEGVCAHVCFSFI